MGLLDVLNGMQNGPRGQRADAPADSGSGMSPITMAILGLLAYKAVKHFGGGQTSPAPAGPGGTANADAQSGGLGDVLGSVLGGSGGSLGGALGNLGNLLPGGLGGLLAGGAAGSILSGGLGDLLKQFQQSGHGEVADSWVGSGPNRQISPDALSKVLTDEQVDTLSKYTGMSRDTLVAELSRRLPEAINHLTPQGRLPTENETSRML